MNNTFRSSFHAQNLTGHKSSFCRRDHETTYERIPGFEPNRGYHFTLLCGSSQHDPGIVGQCASLCTLKDNCQGFVVDYKNHLCYGLLSSVAIPHLSLCVSDAKDFFNRICIPTSISCNNIFTFERIVDQKVLTPVVPRYTIPFISKEACKCLCLEEKKFTCKAVSFEFFNSVCRVFEHDRSSGSMTLEFSQGFEYIENTCGFRSSRNCRYSHPEIDISPTSVVKSLAVRSIYECKHACDTTANFNCRSFNFVDNMAIGKTSNLCLLNPDNSMTVRKDSMKALPRSVLYERHCDC